MKITIRKSMTDMLHSLQIQFSAQRKKNLPEKPFSGRDSGATWPLWQEKTNKQIVQKVQILHHVLEHIPLLTFISSIKWAIIQRKLNINFDERMMFYTFLTINISQCIAPTNRIIWSKWWRQKVLRWMGTSEYCFNYPSGSELQGFQEDYT